MDLRRLRTGEWLTGLAGLVLLVSLFLPWYSTPGPPELDIHGDAFFTYAVFDYVLLVTAVAALGTVVVTAASRATPLPLAYQSLLWIVCAAVGVAAIVQYFSKPGSLLEHEVGSLIGTLAVLALPVTLLVAMRDERLSVPGRPTDATGVPLASEPVVETLPAPRA